MTQYNEKKMSMISDSKRQIESIKKLIDKGNYSKALSELVHYLEESPYDMYGHFLHGKILVKTNDLEGAKQAFLKVASSESSNCYSALSKLGDIEKAEGNINKAKQYYKQTIKESPNKEFNAILALANIEREEKNYDEALSVLNLLGRNDSKALIGRAKIFIEQGRRNAANEILTTIIPKNRKQERQVALEKGRLARICGEYAKAKFHYLEAKENAEKDQTYYRTLYEEAKLAMDLEEYEEVIDNCEELYTDQVEFKGEIHLLLAQAKQAQEKYQSALKSYHLATQSKDENIRYESYYNLGLLEFMMGDLESAEKNLKVSLDSDKISKSRIYLKLLGVLLKEKKYSDARIYLEKTKQLASEITTYSYTLDTIELLINKNTGKKLPKRNGQIYTNRQIIKYSKEDAIHHIKTRHQKTDITSSGFSATIHISTLYEIVKHQMSVENRINEDVFDIYEIDYPNAGYNRDNNEIVNRIRVIAIPGTKDIITMYPCSRSKTPRQGEFNKTEVVQKSKRSDQISKFYQRYNKKQ